LPAAFYGADVTEVLVRANEQKGTQSKEDKSPPETKAKLPTTLSNLFKRRPHYSNQELLTQAEHLIAHINDTGTPSGAPHAERARLFSQPLPKTQDSAHMNKNSRPLALSTGTPSSTSVAPHAVLFPPASSSQPTFSPASSERKIAVRADPLESTGPDLLKEVRILLNQMYPPTDSNHRDNYLAYNLQLKEWEKRPHTLSTQNVATLREMYQILHTALAQSSSTTSLIRPDFTTP
jgi:hypothetical protein